MYEHTPEKVLENDNVKILRDFSTQTNHKLEHKQGVIQKKYEHIGFLAKPKTIAAGGLRGAVSSPGGPG